jgi:hypothetical protein
MREIVQTDKVQATRNQISNVVEYTRFGAVGTKGTFISANGGIGVDIINTRDGCGGATTLDVKVFKGTEPVSKFFRDYRDAETWLNEQLVPVEATNTDERGHTYAPIGGYRPAAAPAAARC